MKRKNITNWVILFLLGLTWGASFILMKRCLRTFDFWQIASIRMLIASLFLLPFGIKNIKKIKKDTIIPLLVVAFIGNFIPSLLFPLGQTRIDSNIAGVLNSLVPIFVLIIGILFFKERTNFVQIIGIIMGLAGSILLISNGDILNLSNINYYSLYIVLATIMYSVNINQTNAFLKHLNGLEITSLAFLFILPVSLIVLLNTELSNGVYSSTFLSDLIYVIILGLVCSAIAVSLINYIITKAGAVFASTVTYIIPIFAIIWGLIDGESIGYTLIITTLIILVSVYMVNKKV